MTVFQCICGVRYRVPPGADGRKVRCKQCGRTAQLPRASEGPIPLADDSHFGVEAAAASVSGSMFQGTTAGTAFDDFDYRPAPRVDAAPRASFWEDVGWSFVFFITPHSLVMFSAVWVLAVMQALMNSVMIPGSYAAMLVGMFVTAWYMNIISETAGGEDELPKFTLSASWWEDVISPAIQYAGTWVLLMLPAMVYAFFIAGTLSNLVPLIAAGADPYTLLIGGGRAVAPLAALIAAGIFLWPAALMCVSMGGLSSLVRIDLIVTSVVNTFLPYSTIVLLVGVATFLPGLLTSLAVGAAPGGAAGGLSTILWLAIVVCGLEVYFSIIVMRLIGLYYRHYKHELAWDWE